MKINVKCESCGKARTINKRSQTTALCRSCSITHHGMSRTKLYECHKNMRSRCNNINSIYYERYGGRGITVHKDWNKFIPFMEWALENGYQDGLEIDRINNDGNYEPENCRFVTHIKNMNNRNHRKTKSGYPFIHEANGSTYRADFVHMGKRYSISDNFKTPKEAAIAYNNFCERNNLDRKRIEVGNT